MDSNPKVNSGKGTGAKPKAAEKKQVIKGALPEQTDDRPRTIKFIKDFGPDDPAAPNNTGREFGINVTEEVAIAFSTAYFDMEIWDTNRETLEETLMDKVSLDLSSILFPPDAIEVSALIFDL